MGNKTLLEREMTAFLAPSHVSPLAVLPALEWATEMAKMGQAVVSGFPSRLEKEVFTALSRGTVFAIFFMAAQSPHSYGYIIIFH